MSKNVVIRGIESGFAFDVLEQVEEHAALRSIATAPGNDRHRRWRKWILSDRLYRRTLLSAVIPQPASLPGLDSPRALLPRAGRIMSWGRALVRPGDRVERRARAEAVHIGRNVRAFYLDVPRPLSVKVVVRTGRLDHSRVVSRPAASRDNGQEEPENGLDGEINAREFAGAFVNIPEILSYDRVGGYAFLTEPVVEGRRPLSRQDHAWVAENMLACFLRMYEASGFRFATPANVLGSSVSMEVVESALKDLRSPASTITCVLASAERLLTDVRCVAISFGHGALTGRNSVIDPDGNVRVLDWESAGEMPIANDLRYLLHAAPSCRHEIEKFLDEVRSNAPVELLTLHEQLALSALKDLVSWHAKRVQDDWRRKSEQVPRNLRSHRQSVRALSSLRLKAEAPR
jgi:hypothetical protein